MDWKNSISSGLNMDSMTLGQACLRGCMSLGMVGQEMEQELRGF